MTHVELVTAGFPVTPAAYERLAQFLRLLATENERVNLTAIRAEGAAWIEHICDSLALLPLVQTERPENLLDLGSGGGLPGLPLACVRPELRVTLLDATRKKVAALERIAAGLGLANVACAWGRAEELAHRPEHRERYAAVTARAVAALPALLEYAAGLVRPAGAGWFFKTRAAAAEEMPAAEAAARACAWQFEAEHRYRLPGHDQERVVLSYRKVGPLRPDLPRPPGRARRRPF